MFAFEDCLLKDPQTSARGAKSCAFTDAKGNKVHFVLGSRACPVSSPFGATSFGDEIGSRRTIEFNLSQEQAAEFQGFDVWARKYLHEHAQRIFKKAIPFEKICEMYHSPVVQKDGYPPRLRCKINVSGAYAARGWDAAHQRTELPEDLRHVEVIPRIAVNHLWIMSKECGFVMQINDLVLLPSCSACPFTDEDLC